jgi:hypothetical protein
MKLEKKNLAGLFCSQPFEYLDIHFVNGNIECYVCCPTWLPTSIGPFGEENVIDIWNNSTIQKIRQSVFDGTYEYCNADLCPEIQDGKLHDVRFAKDPNHRKIIKDNKTYLDRGPRRINFSEDRTCNLSCPSCRTSIISIDKDDLDKIKAFREKFLPRLLETAGSIFVCSAGDPFASPIYKDFLFNLDGKKYPQLEINILTNGVLFTPQTWQSMIKIHKNLHTIFISLDAAKEDTYNIVRRGGDLNKAISNIEFLSTLLNTGTINKLQLDFVVQDTNFRELPDFVALGIRLKVSKVYFQKISNWGSYDSNEFKNKDICSPQHPQHSEFLKVCSNKILSHQIVKRGNLSRFFPISTRSKIVQFLKRITLLRYLNKYFSRS